MNDRQVFATTVVTLAVTAVFLYLSAPVIGHTFYLLSQLKP